MRFNVLDRSNGVSSAEVVVGVGGKGMRGRREMSLSVISSTIFSYSSSFIEALEFGLTFRERLMGGIRAVLPARLDLMFRTSCLILSCEVVGRGFHFFWMVAWDMFLMRGSRVANFWRRMAAEEDDGFDAPIFSRSRTRSCRAWYLARR